MDDISSVDELLFYKSYLELADNKLPFNLDKESRELFKDRGFTKYVIDNEEPVKVVKMLSFVVSHSLLKPQKLLIDNEDYYIAIDLLTNTYYICYRDLMMIDIDKYKINSNSDTLNDIKIKLSKYPSLFFRIYSSRNGYHIFVINKNMNYRSDESIQLMSDIGCDFYYMVYSYLRGWSVRLNKKRGEENIDNLYTWIGDVVRGHFFSSIRFTDLIEKSDNVAQRIDEFTLSNNKIEVDNKLFNSILPDRRLEILSQLHINLVDIFKNAELCNMPAPM